MKTIRIVALMSILLLCSCNKAVLVNDIEENTEKYDYYVDSYGNEGIVVYKGASLCIVMSLDETERAWSNENELVYDLKYSDGNDFYGTKIGLDMLSIMCSNGITKYPAQQWCNEKNHGESPNVGSWRLPSLKEWETIFDDMDDTKFAKINRAIYNYGGVKLKEESIYWTCVEDMEDMWEFSDSTLNVYDPAGRAINLSPYLRAFTNKDNWAKQNVWKVRAIKYVYYEKSLYI